MGRAAALLFQGGPRAAAGARDAPATGGAAAVRARPALLPLGLLPCQGCGRRRLRLAVQSAATRGAALHRRGAGPHACRDFQEARGARLAHPLISVASEDVRGVGDCMEAVMLWHGTIPPKRIA